jgi:hypothetical protein
MADPRWSQEPAGPTPAEEAAKAQAEPSAQGSDPASAAPPAEEKGHGATDQPGQTGATGVREELEERKELGPLRIWFRGALRQTPSWLVSMVFHMVLLLVLALTYFSEARPEESRQLTIAPGEAEQFDELETLADEPLAEIDLSTDIVSLDSDLTADEVEISPAQDMESAAAGVELSEFGLEHAPRSDLLARVGAYSGNALSGRGTGRGELWRKGGGSEGSEKAVAAALKWLAEHQMPDGGWNFDLRLCPKCHGACRNPGTARAARRGATAMALLPFLGAGQTHKSGSRKYRSTVKDGLYFLVSHMTQGPEGGSLHEDVGTMYSHGMGAIVLCEAYAMTHDKWLFGPAQSAINFICSAQDPVGGGWRYFPREPGDTSVLGWQIMALKSGHLAYLVIPPLTVSRAMHFLDSVQSEGGAIYGYTSADVPQDINGRAATTAIGLLCRMYLGWKKDEPGLVRGVKWLSDRGPSQGNMYYNYYATQVLRQYEGPQWEKWNAVMRDQLVKSQATAGHEKGSWFFPGGDLGAERGGRLYCTSMATMVLEVYYRYLPIYRGQAVEEEFPE